MSENVHSHVFKRAVPSFLGVLPCVDFQKISKYPPLSLFVISLGNRVLSHGRKHLFVQVHVTVDIKNIGPFFIFRGLEA